MLSAPCARCETQGKRWANRVAKYPVRGTGDVAKCPFRPSKPQNSAEQCVEVSQEAQYEYAMCPVCGCYCRQSDCYQLSQPFQAVRAFLKLQLLILCTPKKATHARMNAGAHP